MSDAPQAAGQSDIEEPAARAGMYWIGEVAERVGLSLRTLRHYDEAGLIVPSGRTRGGFRLYTDNDVERVALIKRMKPLGFSLEEMRELLALRDGLAGSAVGVANRQSLLAQLREYAASAAKRCDSLRAELEHAQAFADTLGREVARWEGTSVDADGERAEGETGGGRTLLGREAQLRDGW